MSDGPSRPLSGRRRRTLRVLAHLANHAPEDQAVDRIERVPVDEPEQPARREEGRLDDEAAAVVLRRTWNSSQARPGTFISARRRTSRPGSTASTRQKSTASPTRT